MSETPPNRHPESVSRGESVVGLRLRLWIACLGGALLSCAGLWWLIATRLRPGVSESGAQVAWLAAIGAAGLIAGAVLALWLDHVLVGQLRGLTRGLATGRVAELRGLPAASGWGELSHLSDRVQELIGRHRSLSRASDELELVQRQVEELRGALERWVQNERWTPLKSVNAGRLLPLFDSLNRGLGRVDEVRAQNREAARQVLEQFSQALADAQESAVQSERGFVEATALLTTVRELQRLGVELERVIGAPAAVPAPERSDAEAERYRAAARDAIGELVSTSSESLDRLSRGLMHVQEIADQVQVLTNRATLIAINVVVAGGRAERSGPSFEEVAGELKSLALEVRGATERVARLALEIESDVTASSERMSGLRERVAARLVEPPAPVGEAALAAPPISRTEEVTRLMERVREMIQDAARKGERLSGVGERASRAAERLSRVVEQELQELEGLVVRLTAVGPETESASPTAFAPGSGTPPGLRLLGEENLVRDEPPVRGLEEKP